MAFQFQTLIPQPIRTQFYSKLTQIADKFGGSPEHLELFIFYESGRTMSPAKWGGYNKSYVGLIQFGSAAASDLGTTTSALSKMTHIEQLFYVEKYYDLWKKRLKFTSLETLADFYLVVLHPKSVTYNFTDELPFTLKQKAANSQFLDTHGNITKSSITEYFKIWASKNKFNYTDTTADSTISKIDFPVPHLMPTNLKFLIPIILLVGILFLGNTWRKNQYPKTTYQKPNQPYHQQQNKPHQGSSTTFTKRY
jgi:hypothetical protein